MPGGPNVNHRLQLLAGKIQFYMSANSLQAFDAVAQNIPTLVVASMFQKDPQVLLAHPDQGIEKFDDLKKLTLFVSKEGARLLLPVDEARLRLQRAAGEALHLQSAAVPRRQEERDAGLRHVGAVRRREGRASSSRRSSCSPTRASAAYSTLIETRRDMIEKKPDVVQRFVNASVTGWYNYLYGDNTAANARIKRDNPEMSDALIAYSIAKMKEYGIVDSGDSLKLGIGAMTDARMKSFFDKMVAAGVVKGSIDYRKAYTLRFVNKGVGVDLRPKN